MKKPSDADTRELAMKDWDILQNHGHLRTMQIVKQLAEKYGYSVGTLMSWRAKALQAVRIQR